MSKTINAATAAVLALMATGMAFCDENVDVLSMQVMDISGDSDVSNPTSEGGGECFQSTGLYLSSGTVSSLWVNGTSGDNTKNRLYSFYGDRSTPQTTYWEFNGNSSDGFPKRESNIDDLIELKTSDDDYTESFTKSYTWALRGCRKGKDSSTPSKFTLKGLVPGDLYELRLWAQRKSASADDAQTLTMGDVTSASIHYNKDASGLGQYVVVRFVPKVESFICTLTPTGTLAAQMNIVQLWKCKDTIELAAPAGDATSWASYSTVATASETLPSQYRVGLFGCGTVVVESNANVGASDASTTNVFSGIVSGRGTYNKTGAGTDVIIGTNTFAGTLCVKEGTLKFGGIEDCPKTRYILDASEAGAVVTNVAGEVESWSSAVGSYVFADNNSSVKAVVVENENIFGGKKAVYLNKDGVSGSYSRLVNNVNNNSTSTACAMLVYWREKRISGYDVIFGESGANVNLRNRNGSSYDWWAKNSSAGDVFTRGIWQGNKSTDGNSSDMPKIGIQEASIVTAHSPTRKNSNYDALGTDSNGKSGDAFAYETGFCGAVGEIVSFKDSVSVEEQRAFEAYLMAKWGVGGVEYNVFPKITPLKVDSGAVLDLGGLEQTFASLELAGTIKNGTLNITGNATFMSGATIDLPEGTVLKRNLKVMSCDSVTGVENLTVKIGGVVVKGWKARFVHDGIYLVKQGFIIVIS